MPDITHRKIAYDPEHGFITAPLSEEADKVLRDFLLAHSEELDEKLKPLGVEGALIHLPEWERAFYADDERVPAALEAMVKAEAESLTYTPKP